MPDLEILKCYVEMSTLYLQIDFQIDSSKFNCYSRMRQESNERRNGSTKC